MKNKKNIGIITNDDNYQSIQSTLNAGKKPSQTLRFLMRHFENYRQSKKIGWSRLWNKNNVVNFQSFKLNETDAELYQHAWQVISEEWPDMPTEARLFTEQLLKRDSLAKGFLFIQEYNENGQLFEGAVLSFGCINKENRKYRDRVDIILESPIVNGVSQGLSRIRIYIDPHHASLPEAKVLIKELPLTPLSYQLFTKLSDCSWAWASNSARIWDHWVNQYIDYFGERSSFARRSFFYIPENPAGRLDSGSSHDIKNVA